MTGNDVEFKTVKRSELSEYDFIEIPDRESTSLLLLSEM